jgi:hypothetical protein
MAYPNRMPRSEVRNAGSGPFVVFYCESCGRPFNSQPVGHLSAIEDAGKQIASNFLGKIPIVGETLASNVNQSDLGIGKVEEAGMQAVGNFLGRIPIVGETLATSVTGADAHGSSLTPQQMDAAWSQVSSQFRQCPTCGKVVCQADFDDQQGVCRSHSGAQSAAPQGQYGQYGAPAAAPTQGQYGQYDTPPAAAAQGQYGQYDTPAAVPAQGQSGQYDTPAAQTPAGLTGQYDTPAPAPVVDQSLAHCPNDGTQALAGTKFCPNCGTAMVQPAPVKAGLHCPSCGVEVQPGTHFCPSCGTKLEQPAPAGICPKCGTEAKGAKFCPNCGTKIG